MAESGKTTGEAMEPDTTKIWTRAEIRAAVGKVLVESLGVDEATVTEDAALIRDLGAESIDFLDISFKAQQIFGVDFPARLIQDRVTAWRDLAMVAQVIEARYGVAVTPEELRTVVPATVGAILEHLASKHGVARRRDDEAALAIALAEHLLTDLAQIGIDFSDLSVDVMAAHLLDTVYSPAAMDEVMNRFTVRALTEYIASELGKVSRLATDA
jgi:acyl carrier protein